MPVFSVNLLRIGSIKYGCLYEYTFTSSRVFPDDHDSAYVVLRIKIVNEKSEIIKITIVRKYLFIS